MINIERGGNKEEESENKDNTFDITKYYLDIHNAPSLILEKGPGTTPYRLSTDVLYNVTSRAALDRGTSLRRDCSASPHRHS
jgi:hypothetical protein